MVLVWFGLVLCRDKHMVWGIVFSGWAMLGSL